MVTTPQHTTRAKLQISTTGAAAITITTTCHSGRIRTKVTKTPIVRYEQEQ